MQNNLISVITPVYNAAAFIERTVESVLNQTYKNIEHILVDDCSTDKSEEILREWMKKDSRIKYIRLKENSGAAVARNTGLEHAKGQYIAFIDSDDIWKPEKLEKQLQFMQDHQYAFTYTKFEMISEEGEVVHTSAELPDKLNYTGLLKNTAIACSTVIIDRKIVGDFRMPLVRKGQDTATWLQILRKLDFAYGLNEVLGQYRQVKGSISSDRVGALKRTWNTYYRLEKLPLPKALYYFTFYTFNAIRRRL
ncbi:glycosyltransferase family 2 protein [Jeotgalibaca sp. MA1X17-3]|uniref:glycosyltransferase family 2 protein n=1 Tax=Jeotgalibaca sp. MA1X17-3 TaxID=2908211 RepID=UPI001F2633FA|nr:glycosyltransferase family 2 protein [Jeotgalibaca sp. MA1X17-3]UJF15243.1 glycosyltransferase family 2 protein [Jeotgalibaca sp. MA1X17-3]